MNTYYGQYIRNRYPEYSRIRNDDNSVGGKILTTIGDFFQLQLNELKKRNFNNRAIENLPILEPEAYFEIQLNQNEDFQNWISNLNNQINNITVTGYRNDDFTNVLKTDTLNSFLETVPTGIESLKKIKQLDLNKNNLFNLGKDTDFYNGEFYLGEEGQHVYLEVPKEWNNHLNKKERLLFLSADSVPFFQYDFFIILRGIDIADKEVEERIQIGIESIYRTKTKFKYLKTLVPDNTKGIQGSFLLERFGFVAPISVYLFYNKDKEIVRYDMFDLVLKKRIENENSSIWSDCFLNLNNNYLNYYFCLFNESQLPIFNNYDFFNNITYSDIQSKSFVKIIEQELVLPIGSSFDEHIEDFAIDIQRNKIIVITNLLKIIYYDIGKNNFENPSFGRTKQISLEIESDNQRIKTNTQKNLKLFNSNFDFKIEQLCIFRKTPFASANEIEFLNANYEWQFTPFVFSEKIFYSSDIFKQQFSDFDFINKIKIPVTFNIPGQWDFYVLSFSNQNKELSNFLIESNFDGQQFSLYLKNRSIDNLTNPIHEFELNYKSFYVENNLPIKTFDFFNEFENFITESNIDISNIKLNLELNTNNSLLFVYVTDLTNQNIYIYETKMHTDVFVYDIERKTIYAQEDYDNMIVNINNSEVSFSILRD